MTTSPKGKKPKRRRSLWQRVCHLSHVGILTGIGGLYFSEFVFTVPYTPIAFGVAYFVYAIVVMVEPPDDEPPTVAPGEA
jgi:hypothetical protein